MRLGLVHDMTNRSKQKGTQWESAIVAYLQANGWPHAERRALHGALDKGDVAGLPEVVIEAKNAKTIALASWLDEANVEGANAGAAVSAVWFKRRGKTSPGAGYVLMDGAMFVQLLIEAGY